MLENFNALMDCYRTDPPPRRQRAATTNAHQQTAHPAGGSQTRSSNNMSPRCCLNGMIDPIIPYAMKGVIWYQGESITGGDAGLSLYPHIQMPWSKIRAHRWARVISRSMSCSSRR